MFQRKNVCTDQHFFKEKKKEKKSMQISKKSNSSHLKRCNIKPYSGVFVHFSTMELAKLCNRYISDITYNSIVLLALFFILVIIIYIHVCNCSMCVKYYVDYVST